jgi:hypothetical protein
MYDLVSTYMLALLCCLATLFPGFFSGQAFSCFFLVRGPFQFPRLDDGCCVNEVDDVTVVPTIISILPIRSENGQAAWEYGKYTL